MKVKYLFRSMLAMAGVFAATSCSQEELYTETEGDFVEASFTIETPDGILSRAVGDGTTVDQVTCAVFDANGVEMAQLRKNIEIVGKAAQYNVRLAKGQAYRVAFFAYDKDANAYDVTDMKNIKVNGNQASNLEGRDAFTAKFDVTPTTAAIKETVTLYRPFAQLNLGAYKDDVAAAAAAGIVVTNTQVTVSNVYTAFSAYDDAVVGGTSEMTFALNAIPTQDLDVDINRDNNITADEKFAYLALNYILVGDKGSEKSLADIKFTWKTAAGKTNNPISTFENIPVQRNYRTNIVGWLLTNPAEFNIVIDERFEDNSKYGSIDGKVYKAVNTAEEFNAAFVDENIDMIILGQDIVLNSTLSRSNADPVLTVSAKKELIIDLNGKTLSSTSSETGKNYNMFDVRGTLTVKNGKMEYKHEGTNMEWNNSTNLFNVTAGGVLNLEGVTAKNMGGSDMAFVAHLNNWGEVTLNVNNSTLESTYIPVRVFNSGNDMNNVTIKNTTLKGKYCFWVHNYKAAGDNVGSAETLNFDIFNGTNTFEYNNDNDAPVLYGFNEPIYLDENGEEIKFWTPIEGAEGVGIDPEGNYVITADEGLASLSALIAADDNNFAGKTIKLECDVDLTAVKTNGDSFAPIGSTGERDDRNRLICEPFKGTFDGQGHAIKGIYQSGWDMGYEWGQYGSIGLFAELEGATVKNVVIEALEAQVEGGDISFIAGSATGDCVFENIEIKNSKIGTYNNGCGGIIGWSGAGTYTFKDIKIGSDVVLGGLWGSFDSSIGGIVGQAEPGATYIFENVEINCRIDAYNDCTASYDYYNYRMCGMIIGRCEKTTTINGVNYPDLSQYNLSFKNVTVNYGDWMNYHYCEPTPGHNNGRGMRIEPGFTYGGLPSDYDHSQCVDNHMNWIPFNQLVGGDQLGVKGLPAVDGVTVNYPASYYEEKEKGDGGHESCLHK